MRNELKAKNNRRAKDSKYGLLLLLFSTLIRRIEPSMRLINGGHFANIRELKQSRRRRQQERHKFAYLTMKNSTFARFGRAFFIFGHLADVLDLSTT